MCSPETCLAEGQMVGKDPQGSGLVGVDRQVPGAPQTVGLGVKKAVSLGKSGREGRHPASPSTRNGPRKSEFLKCMSSGVRGWGSSPRFWKKGPLTEEAGQDPHVCGVRGRGGVGGDGSSRGEEAAVTGGREGGRAL